MRFIVPLAIALVAVASCLPDVSTELSEPEARALLQREVLTICGARSQTVISNTLNAVQTAQASPTRDYWIFTVRLPGPNSEHEALVFPSKIVAGNLIVELETRTCR